MVPRLSRIAVAFAGLSLFASACSKDDKKEKYNLSKSHQERQLIVTFKPNMQRSLVQARLLSSQGDSEALNEDSYLIRFKDDLDLKKKADELAASPGVRAVEANVVYNLYEKTPNDLDFTKLYALSNTGQSSGVAGADVGATKAWDVSTGSKNVLVGIIDSGMDYNHPDLASNVWSNPGETGLDANGNDKRTNGIDDDGNGFVDDWHGWDFYNNDNDPMDDNSHGTHVAGTIGGVGNNGVGVAGVNWAVSMVPIKVFSAAGETTTDILVKGVDYATKLGVFVTNNSWGGGAYSDAIFASIQKAADANILFVAASGNESANNDSGEHYPSNYNLPNIISVASINRRDQLSTFSNFGAKTVDVAAPGEEIFSTVPGGLYALKSGTSMATPHVTGALALIRSVFPNIPALDIRAKLLASSVQTPALIDKVISGRINVGNAMETDTIAPAPVTGFTVTDTNINSIFVTWNLTGDDGTVGEASGYNIRMSATPITTEDEWAAAETTSMLDFKRVASAYTATLSEVTLNRAGFITIRATDNVGNLSGLSASISFKLKTVAVLWSEDNGATNDWAAFGTPWAVTTVNGITTVSDSPNGLYENSIDKSVVSKDIALGNANLVLEIRSKYQLEKDYDWGYIELSTDSGITWKEVGKVNGNSDWTTVSYNLKDLIGTAVSFKLRLRIKSDQTVNFDGWDVDSLRIVGQSN
ncbi:MAG: S8 family serine peptidase [Chitinophagaceae bacterium]|nr:S8 family serine peptidase [Oligoflexus sp.]